MGGPLLTALVAAMCSLLLPNCKGSHCAFIPMNIKYLRVVFVGGGWSHNGFQNPLLIWCISFRLRDWYKAYTIFARKLALTVTAHRTVLASDSGQPYAGEWTKWGLHLFLLQGRNHASKVGGPNRAKSESRARSARDLRGKSESRAN